MKQITQVQAESLAFANESKLRWEIQYCQEDWIRENARYIADIECKRADKTLYGQWPKGWKAQMVKDSAESAKANLLAAFLRDECRLIDEAIWLGNWQMIQKIETSQS